MDSSPAISPADGGPKKRARVSRACDSCFTRRDRCDGVRPICKVCTTLDRPCTYNRPERKRGPSQGVRQKLEGQVESLESILGYMVDTYPQLCSDIARNLRLEDAEASLLNSPQMNTLGAAASASASSSSVHATINIYPQFSRQDARDRWRISALAKAIAPSLGLNLAGEDEEDELYGKDALRNRIEEARMARSRLRNGVPDILPGLSSFHSNHLHYYRSTPSYSQQQQQQQPLAPPPPLNSASLLPHYSHSSSPGPTFHASHFLQHYPIKERPFAGLPTSTPPHPISFTSPEQQQQQQGYPLLSRVPSEQQQQRFLSSTTTVTPQLIPYESYSSPSFARETDALAYALGMTYSASPPNDHLVNRNQTPSSWIGSHHTLHQNNQHSSVMHPIDQHLQASPTLEEEDDQQSIGLNFFSDHDLSQQSTNQQLSVLHQLGLQGSIDMPTPVDHSSDRGGGGSSHSVAASHTPTQHHTSTSNSSNPHHSASHWIQQPIRSMN